MRRFVLAFALVASPAMAQDAAGDAGGMAPEAAREAVRAFFAAPSLPGIVAAEAGNVALAGTTVTLDAVTLTLALPTSEATPAARATLAAPVVLVDGLARTADGWRAGAIRIPDATVATGDGTPFPLGRIEIAAPAWPADIAPPLTAGPAAAYAPALDFLAGVSASGVTVEGEDRRFAAGRIEDGRIATLSARFALGDEVPAEVAASGIDLAAIRDALFADGGAPAVALERLHIAPFGDTLTEGRTAQVGAFSVEGVRLTPQSPPLAARIDDVAAHQAAAAASAPAATDPGMDGAVEEAPVTPESVDLALALWQAIAVDRIVSDGYRTTLADGARPAQAGRTTITNVGVGRAMDLVSEGFESELPEGDRMRIDRMELIGVVVPEARFIRELALAGDTPPPVASIVGALPIARRAALSGLEMETATGWTIAVDEAAFEMSGHIGTIPTTIASRVAGFADFSEADAPDDVSAAQLLDELEALGIERLSFRGGDRIAWADGRLVYESEIDVSQFVRAKVAIGLSGIPGFVFSEPERAMEIIAFLALDDVVVEVADQGLVGFVRRVHEAQGRDVEAEAAGDLDRIETELAATLGPDNARIVRDAFAAFVAGGRTLTLTGRPKQPVPLTQVGVAAIAPRALVDLLGLTLVATP